MAGAILGKLGYRAAALTAPGQENAHEYLHSLGATEFVGGPEWSKLPRPLETRRWTGAIIDNVGSKVLSRVLAEMDYPGCVANCGLAGRFDLATTVMPFILRRVSLRGVDSVMCPIEKCKNRLAADLPVKALESINPQAIFLPIDLRRRRILWREKFAGCCLWM